MGNGWARVVSERVGATEMSPSVGRVRVWREQWASSRLDSAVDCECGSWVMRPADNQVRDTTQSLLTPLAICSGEDDGIVPKVR